MVKRWRRFCKNEKKKTLNPNCVCVFVSFQETEEDLGETEEYKEARNILDSVKLEG